MMLTVSCIQEQTQILGLSLAGGATRSIFPAVEEELNRCNGKRRAIASIADGRSPDLFRSYMDYLVCSVFPEILPLCMNYYRDEGAPLRDQITHEGRDHMELLLLGVVEIAWLSYQHEHTLDWDQTRQLLLFLNIPKIDIIDS